MLVGIYQHPACPCSRPAARSPWEAGGCINIESNAIFLLPTDIMFQVCTLHLGATARLAVFEPAQGGVTLHRSSSLRGPSLRMQICSTEYKVVAAGTRSPWLIQAVRFALQKRAFTFQACHADFLFDVILPCTPYGLPWSFYSLFLQRYSSRT